MSIRILTARAHRLFQPIVDELGVHLRKDDSCILLVPEQLTLTAEQEIMSRLQVKGLFFVDVMSPSRLNDHILSLTGRSDEEPLSDAGQRMAISQALERLEDQLPYYGSITQRRGFVEKLSALITDLKRGGMTPDALETFAQTQSTGGAQEKLKDLFQIYRQYQAVTKGRFSDNEDMLTYVAGQLKKSGFLQHKHLYVYGFDSLPQQLMQLLRSAAPLCESLTIGLICDTESAPDGDIYTPVRQGIARFRAMLRQDGMDVRLCPIAPSPLDGAGPMRHLDQALFARQPKPYGKPARGITLSSSLTPYEEATLMSRQLLWVLQHGVSIEKVAVFYPEGGDYDFAVTAALTDSGLPFYTDQQLPASNHGLVRFLLSALHAMADGWRNRDVIGMLKSGYAPLSFEQCCQLENYAYEHGIDRVRWAKPFQRGDEEEIAQCEPLRKQLMAPLLKARAAIVAARDAASGMTAVFQLLLEVHAYDTLKQEEERLLASGFLTRSGQNSQVWQVICDLLDEMARIGGQNRIPLKYIATRMECGFSAVSIGTLPPASGMLHVGTLGHMLTEEADAVFLLGLNDGVLSRSTDSLLTQDERAVIQEGTGAFLGLTDESRVLLAKLDLKRAMTLPKKYLFLSYAKTDSAGTAQRPLSLLDSLSRRLFDGMDEACAARLPMSATQTLNRLSLLMRACGEGVKSLSPEWKQRIEQLAQSHGDDVFRLADALSASNDPAPVSSDSARALYGDDTLSISRLEQFAACPFKHFITYGLRPRVLKEWKVDPIQTGTFYHDGLNCFAHLARKNPAFPKLTSQQVDELVNQAVAPMTADVLNGPMGDGDRNIARFEQAKATLNRAAQVITGQLAAGRFQLYKTEASFGYEGGLPPIVLEMENGRQIALRGRIDRIDRYDSPDSVYLRVIDYKSAQQNLEAARTWWGLQLQLLLYLDVCTSAIPGSCPAGAFYFYVGNPLLESDTDVKEIVEAKLREVFYLRGIVLNDVEVFDASDAEEVPYVLPPLRLKNGELKKNARALDFSQFEALLRHARNVAADLAGQLFGGDVSISPCMDQTRLACDLCEYQAICRIDPESAPCRQLPEMSMDQLRERLKTS